MELSESGKVQKRYVRGTDLVYADRGKGTEKQYYVTDPHGNVVQLTDGEGKIMKTYEYDSFGNEVKPDGKDDNSFRYCGEYYDKETGEVYLRARYYQPEKGRFLTRDSYTGEKDEPESLHLYAYCGNDGVNHVDPSGHDAIWLNSSKSAKKLGHAAVLIKNSHDKWDYLSYSGGEKGGLLKKTLTNYYSKANYRFVLQYINDQYRNKGKMRPYDGCIYFKGKFKSVKNETIENKDKYQAKSYDETNHNCLDIAVDFLRKGKFQRYNQEYHAALGYAMAMVIPNNAFAGMTYFDDTIDDYMDAGWFRRIFLINPYRVFIDLMQRSII